MRVAVIIDSPNLKGMMAQVNNKRVNWTAFLKHIKWLGKKETNRQTEITIQKIFYDHRPYDNNVNSFLQYMQDQGFELVGVPLKVYAPNPTDKVFKSRTDHKLAVVVMKHLVANDFDTLVLVSGDGDYEFLIDECRRAGKEIWVWATFGTLANELKTASTRYYYFHDHDHKHLLTRIGSNDVSSVTANL